MAKVVTIPWKLTMRKWTCDYCNEPAMHRHIAYGFQHGIITCDKPEDINRATRDINSYFHINMCVKMDDFLQKFPDIASIPSISIYRSDGRITPNGTFLLSEKFGNCSFVKKFDDDWTIPVSFYIDEFSESMKQMPIKYLTYSGVSQSDVDAIISTLDEGIYKADYDAYQMTMSS